MLDAASCYCALRTRDPRFDGRFFVAVRSTGIFCRPICPARTPRRENCWFVPSAAAAREAGFRPCLRCRPEAAPGSPAWAGTSATVHRALRLIETGALDGCDVGALAERLGVGERHLRRLFSRHLGASPRAVAQTRRVLFAKKLIDDTDLPMIDVAATAGFASVRRFNDAIRRSYDRPPRDLRRQRRAQATGGAGLTLELAYRPPLAWDRLLAFLALRAIPHVEQVTGDRYRRTFRIGDAAGAIEVRPGRRAGLAVRIHAAARTPLAPVVASLRRLFDLDADPAAIAAHLAADPLLAPSLERTPGLRVPGAFDGFELGVRAILGQQVSVRGATTLAGRLVERFGEPLTEAPAGGPGRLFPSALRLRRARIEAIGLPSARAVAIRGFAQAVADGQLRLDGSEDPEQAREGLLALPGIGPWTADYVALRALREPDAFPAGDLGLRKAAGGPAGPMPERTLRARAEAWRPWRAYAALHLWEQLGAAGPPAHRTPSVPSTRRRRASA